MHVQQGRSVITHLAALLGTFLFTRQALSHGVSLNTDIIILVQSLSRLPSLSTSALLCMV